MKAHRWSHHEYRPRDEPVVTRLYDGVVVPSICRCGHRADVELTIDEAALYFPNLKPAGVSPHRRAVITRLRLTCSL